MAAGQGQLGVNPRGPCLCIEDSIVQGNSCVLWDEVTFDPAMVTSLDWLSYPILDLTDAPTPSTSCRSIGPTCRHPAPARTSNMTKRVALDLRVSTGEQSTANQRLELQAWQLGAATR
jgi:hypothetical protein